MVALVALVALLVKLGIDHCTEEQTQNSAIFDITRLSMANQSSSSFDQHRYQFDKGLWQANIPLHDFEAIR